MCAAVYNISTKQEGKVLREAVQAGGRGGSEKEGSLTSLGEPGRVF